MQRLVWTIGFGRCCSCEFLRCWPSRFLVETRRHPFKRARGLAVASGTICRYDFGGSANITTSQYEAKTRPHSFCYTTAERPHLAPVDQHPQSHPALPPVSPDRDPQPLPRSVTERPSSIAMRLFDTLALTILVPAAFADVKFTSPSAGDNVDPGTISIAWTDSGDSPSLSDLSTYTIQLMVGGNSDTNAVRTSLLYYMSDRMWRSRGRSKSMGTRTGHKSTAIEFAWKREFR